MKVNWKRLRSLMFVCHGNICRSPMAHCLMEHLLVQNGLGQTIFVDSAATSCEELGNPIHPGAQAELQRRGIPILSHRATQLSRFDWDDCDLFIGMDAWNLRNMLRIFGEKGAEKCCRLLDFTDTPGDIADPWYTGDFRDTWEGVSKGCHAILQLIKENRE